MAVCSKCGVTVQDQNLQPDAEGKLVCRTCAGAWRAKSGQLSAAQSRQESSPGFWMPLALAASALSVLLLIIAIAVGVSKSSIRKEVDGLKRDKTNLQAEKQRVDEAYNEVIRERDRARDDLAMSQVDLAARDKELADLKAGKKPKTTTAGTGTSTGTGTGTSSGFDFPGTSTGGAADNPPPANSVYANKGGKSYHLKTCKYYGASSTAMTVSEARKKGLSPCRFCKPPSK